MLQYVRPLSTNKLHIHASLRASDELVVVDDQMSDDDNQSLALDGIHSSRERS